MEGEKLTEEQIPEEDEINLLDYLIILFKHEKLIIYTTVGAAVFTAITSLIMTPVYEAKTTILPPQQNGPSVSQLLGSSALTIIGGGLPSIKNPGELYIRLLRSRTVLDDVVSRLDLLKYYRAKSRHAARRRLLGALKTSNDFRSGVITIGVEDKSPKESAAMANAFVKALQDINGDLAITAAAQKRLFFQEQLSEVKSALVKAEEAMESFQRKTGLVEADAQGKAVIKAIAGIRAQIAAKEVQLRVMRIYSTPANPILRRVQEQLAGFRAEANKLEAGVGDDSREPFIPTIKIPAVQAGYSNRLMDLKFTEKLYRLLQSQYESAKLGEAGDPSIIQVIDKAVPPNQRARPLRKRMVLASMVVAFLFSIVAAFLIDYKEKFSDKPENRERLEAIKKYTGLQFIWPSNPRFRFKKRPRLR